jgi:hypothetical protein
MGQLNLLLVLSLLILTSCAPEKGVTKILVARDPGGAILGAVTLPGTYDVSQDGPWYSDVKARISKTPTREEVLLRFYNIRLEGVVLSGECFAVSTDGKFTARKAKLEEWDKADPAESRDVFNARADTVLADGDRLTFHGKEFRHGGLTDGRGFGSASGKYLASLSRTVKEVWTLIRIPGRGPAQTAEEYVEIFDVRSGNRLLAVFAIELGAIDEGFGTWLKDRVYVLPYQGSGSQGFTPFCLLAILPEK